MIPTKITRSMLLTALRATCRCADGNPPTDWVSGASIPHHTDCPMFPIELPRRDALAARACALAQRDELVRR